MKAKIIKFLKVEYKFFIGLLIFFILAVLPLPYYVTIGGGTTRIDDKIVVENEYKSNGSFNVTYVSEMKATPLSYLAAKIIGLEIEKIDDIKATNETEKEYEERTRLDLKESSDNATIVAYGKAGEQIEILNTKLRVIYITEQAQTNLKFNDIVLKVNDTKISTTDDLTKLMETNEIDDSLNLTVLRNDKEMNCYAKVIELEDRKVFGIYLFSDKELKTDRSISFEEMKRTSGSSAGLMMSLSVYNKLVEEDITKGLKIAGTGTIDDEGNVGQIGGIKHKLKAAVKGKADIFIAPNGENYQEVVDLVKEKKYNIKIIRATTFEQVLEDLK